MRAAFRMERSSLPTTLHRQEEREKYPGIGPSSSCSRRFPEKPGLAAGPIHSEARSPGPERNPKGEAEAHAAFGLQISAFGIPSDLGFRPSDFRHPLHAVRPNEAGAQPLSSLRTTLPASHTRQYPGSTSVLPPFFLRSTSASFAEVERGLYGGRTEVGRR